MAANEQVTKFLEEAIEKARETSRREQLRAQLRDLLNPPAVGNDVIFVPDPDD